MAPVYFRQFCEITAKETIQCAAGILADGTLIFPDRVFLKDWGHDDL